MPRFEWDEYNIDHLANHAITPQEIEELFSQPLIRQRGGTDAPDRFRVLGRTLDGRYLVVIYQQKSAGVIRPFTGWDMRPHERRLYDRQIRR